ncbi:MAG: glycosyltransferase family 2 protein [Planctomycetes bacterium]|nr:glycosyltransferase family 2 protein [Planctomycetota bacterium]
MPAVHEIRLSVVIPVYNERNTIKNVIERVKNSIKKQNLKAEVIVVNDGSKDGSSDVIQTIDNIKFIDLKQNKGKGAAIKAGFKKATGDILLIQDADMEYDPDDYTAVITPIVFGKSKFVLGSRFLKERPIFFGKKKSPYFNHYIGNKLIIWVTNLLYLQHGTDYEGCYKAFTKDLIRSTHIYSNGFEYDNELVCKILKRGHRLIEVPISYKPRTYEMGKKINWKHGAKILWTILKYRFLD